MTINELNIYQFSFGVENGIDGIRIKIIWFFFLKEIDFH